MYRVNHRCLIYLIGSLEKNEEDAESRLISIIRFLKAIIEKDWSFAEYLEPMITCLFAAIQRFVKIWNHYIAHVPKTN